MDIKIAQEVLACLSVQGDLTHWRDELEEECISTTKHSRRSSGNASVVFFVFNYCPCFVTILFDKLTIE
jgi:hypothetical protein